MSLFPKMGTLRLIEGGTPPETPAEKVRATLRKTKQRGIPQCGTCAGREYIVSRCGTVRTKICVVCLTQGRRREMTTL